MIVWDCVGFLVVVADSGGLLRILVVCVVLCGILWDSE